MSPENFRFRVAYVRYTFPTSFLLPPRGRRGQSMRQPIALGSTPIVAWVWIESSISPRLRTTTSPRGTSHGRHRLPKFIRIQVECPSIADRVQIGSRQALALMHEMYEQYHNAPRIRQSGRKRST